MTTKLPTGPGPQWGGGGRPPDRALTSAEYLVPMNKEKILDYGRI